MIPSAIAPTGGGGGGGYAKSTATGQQSTPLSGTAGIGGNGGGILKQNPVSPSANQTVVPGVIGYTGFDSIVNELNINKTSSVSIFNTNDSHVFWNNIRFGIGGIGGTPGRFGQVGGFPGGGGGGGAGGGGTGQPGARGGNGMVIVITEH
jgi:hypothetical protein